MAAGESASFEIYQACFSKTRELNDSLRFVTRPSSNGEKEPKIEFVPAGRGSSGWKHMLLKRASLGIPTPKAATPSSLLRSGGPPAESPVRRTTATRVGFVLLVTISTSSVEKGAHLSLSLSRSQKDGIFMEAMGEDGGNRTGQGQIPAPWSVGLKPASNHHHR